MASRLNFVLRVGAAQAPTNLTMSDAVDATPSRELPTVALVSEHLGEPKKDNTGDNAECLGMCAQICCFCCQP
jgi:hypothetical protein